MRLDVLGGFRLEQAGKPVKLATRKNESLFAFLALRRGAHDRNTLAALLWGDARDEDARRSLRVALSNIRAILGDEVLAEGKMVQLGADLSCEVDALAFEAALAPLLGQPAGEDFAEAMQAALAHYTGEFMTGYHDEWIASERERYRSAYTGGLLRLIAHHRAQHAYAAAIEAGNRVLQTDPANEAAHQHLMFCHMALGDRAAALLQFEKCRHALKDAYGVEPSNDTLKLLSAVQDVRAGASDAARLSNVPRPLTSFIGRQHELDAVGRLMATERLITLTGSGGCGKTRLAIELANELADTFEHGAWWVDLGPVTDPDLVPHTIGKALGMPAQDHTLGGVARYLRDRQRLIALDNCEHLIAPAAGFAERVLSECPRVSILATSREPLNVPGEVIWRVPTLAVPEERGAPGADRSTAGHNPGMLLRFAAVKLFVERATAANRDFRLSADNAADVIAICRRLDGIPLAIELAAARARAFSPGQIVQRLDQRFGLLTGGSRTALPRQQTLRALVDWSHDLLTEDEQVLFRRLGAFVGGFGLEAAEAVCGGPPLAARDVLELLSRLVNKSLVLAREEDGRARYAMLETLRDYAAERLRAADKLRAADELRVEERPRAADEDERTRTARRHAQFFAELARQGGEALTAGRDNLAWLDRLDRDLDNLRAAMAWALDHGETATAVTIIGWMPSFWSTRGHFTEGRRWLDRAAELQFENPPPELQRLRAEVLSTAGFYAFRQNDTERATALFERALALAEAIGDRRVKATVLGHLGLLAHNRQAFDEATDYYRQALAIRRELNIPSSVAISLNQLGLVAQYRQDYDQADRLYAEALEIRRQLGDERGEAVVLINMGDVAMFRGEWGAARMLHERSLALCERLKHKQAKAIVLNRLALHDLREGDAARAAEKCGESLALFEELHDRRGMAEAWERMAAVAGAQDDWARVARLSGMADAARAAIGIPLAPPDRAGHDRVLQRARERLAANAFDAAWREGQRASPDSAREL